MDGVDSMSKAELIMMCDKYGVDGGKTVAQLRYNLKRYFETHGTDDQSDDDQPKKKKAKADPMAQAVAAQAAKLQAKLDGKPPPTPSAPSTPNASAATATPAAASTLPTCPKGSLCPELHSLTHRNQFEHVGFRANPIKCRDGMGCSMLKDKAHLARYAHDDNLDRVCKDGAQCQYLHLMHHRTAFEHPGFRATPFPCRDGLSCPLLMDRAHAYKYAHIDPNAGTPAALDAAPVAAAAAASPVVPAPPIPAALAASPDNSNSMPPPALSPANSGAGLTSPNTAVVPGTDSTTPPMPTPGPSYTIDTIKALASGKSMDAFPLDVAQPAVLIPVDKDTEEFWDVEEKFAANLQGRNEDYVAKRIKKGKKPLRFILTGLERVSNPVLEARFEVKRAELMALRGPKDLRERISFHGTHPKNVMSILHRSLLRFKHKFNPCKTQVDDGYFGTNKKGIYVSRYADYTLKYANRVCPVDPDDEVKVIMFKTLPGKSKHIDTLVGAIDPHDGFDSHSSPTFLEWYLFDEAQACPVYVLKIKAMEDTRTAADDQ